ncbi:MAG: TIGR02597 family protein, partial [Akkermansiaceae bacterium]|nr:TIGR02597 family protein [Akkermansiaceae bacterium]
HWRRVGAPAATDFDSTQLIPDRFFIVHHPTSVTQATTYKVNAHDDIYKFNVRLLTCSTSRQETPVGLLRPVDLELNDLNLGGTPAFMTSLSMLISGRRDELLMYDNAAAGFNKGPSARYFYFDGKWLKQGAGNADHGGDVIPAGWGFVIRKYSGTGASVNWTLPE